MAININKIEFIVNNMDNTRAVNDQGSKIDRLIERLISIVIHR